MADNTTFTATGSADSGTTGTSFGKVVYDSTAITAADIAFAIDRGYDARRRNPRTGGPRLGEHLVRSGRLKEEDLRKALRTQKRTGKMLGEVLVDLNFMTRSELEEELKKL